MLLFISSVFSLLLFTSTAAQESPVGCPGSLPPRLTIGGRGRVTPGDPNLVRGATSTQYEPRGRIAGGDSFAVIDGPVCNGGYTWWFVKAGTLAGWTVEGSGSTYWLEPLETQPATITEPQIALTFPYNGFPDLFLMNADGSNLHNIAYSPDYVETLEWSPDGSQIAYIARNYETMQQDIFVIDVVTEGEPRRLTSEPGYYENITWSANSSQIAFTQRKSAAINEEGPMYVYVISADGSHLHEISDEGGWLLKWSPDGNYLLVMRHVALYNYELRIIDTNGVTIREVVKDHPTPIDDFEWSPDSSQIVYLLKPEGAATRTLYVADAAGGEPRQLLQDTNVYSGTVWSPDGREILYRKRISGTSEIYKVNADGSNRRRLTNNDENETDPAWSPDGSQILFINSFTNRTGIGEFFLASMGADGSNYRRILGHVTPHMYWRTFAWRPQPK